MLNDYARSPLLTPAEEIHLGTLVSTWLNWPDGPDNAPTKVRRAGLRARDRMIQANTKLVVSVARKFCRVSFNEDRMMECIQNGMLGLARAAEKFDPERGYKFSTYAYWWIQQSIGRNGEFENVIRIPGHVAAEYRKIEKAIEQIRAEKRPVSAALISELTGITEATIAARIEIGKVRVVQSLDQLANAEEGGSSLIDLIPDENSVDLDDGLHLEELRALYDQRLTQLKPMQAAVIEMTREGMAQKEIGEHLGISRAGVGLHLANARKAMAAAAA